MLCLHFTHGIAPTEFLMTVQQQLVCLETDNFATTSFALLSSSVGAQSLHVILAMNITYYLHMCTLDAINYRYIYLNVCICYT